MIHWMIKKKIGISEGVRFESADDTLQRKNGTILVKIDSAGSINYKRVTRVTDSSVRGTATTYGVTSTTSFEVSLRCINSTRLFIYNPATLSVCIR